MLTTNGDYMENITWTCDICQKQIVDYNYDATLSYQNGEGMVNFQNLLINEYRIKHTCLKCVSLLAASIDARVNTLKDASSA